MLLYNCFLHACVFHLFKYLYFFFGMGWDLKYFAFVDPVKWVKKKICLFFGPCFGSCCSCFLHISLCERILNTPPLPGRWSAPTTSSIGSDTSNIVNLKTGLTKTPVVTCTTTFRIWASRLREVCNTLALCNEHQGLLLCATKKILSALTPLDVCWKNLVHQVRVGKYPFIHFRPNELLHISTNNQFF